MKVAIILWYEIPIKLITSCSEPQHCLCSTCLLPRVVVGNRMQITNNACQAGNVNMTPPQNKPFTVIGLFFNSESLQKPLLTPFINFKFGLNVAITQKNEITTKIFFFPHKLGGPHRVNYLLKVSPLACFNAGNLKFGLKAAINQLKNKMKPNNKFSLTY